MTKNKLIKYIIMTFCLLSFYSASGAVVGNIKTSGKVVKYNKQTVTLIQEEGGRIEVPRKFIPKHYKIKTGYIVTAFLPGKLIQKQ